MPCRETPCCRREEMVDIDRELLPALEQRRQQHLYRTRHVLTSPQGVQVETGGRSYVAFCSNDYLGLANHPEVVKTLQQAAADWGVGSGASHLIYGHCHQHHALEEELAEFTGRPRALLFSTGYMANMGVIRALAEQGDHIFEDYLNHASLLDGGFLSRARCKRFKHSDIDDLEHSLESVGNTGRKLVVSDGVFSMVGDLVRLPELAKTCDQYGAWLMVDDAHGFGVLGERGGGVAEHFGMGVNDLPILVGTLGKGFGTFGAFVSGSEALIETLIQYARTYIYTTALPPAVAAATRTSLKILQRESWRREKLQALITQFRHGVEQIGLELLPSATAVQPVLLRDDRLVMEVGAALRQRGYLVGAIRPPTVPRGSGRLRITLSAEHSEAQVDGLLTALADGVGESR